MCQALGLQDPLALLPLRRTAVIADQLGLRRPAVLVLPSPQQHPAVLEGQLRQVSEISYLWRSCTLVVLATKALYAIIKRCAGTLNFKWCNDLNIACPCS